MLRLSNRYTTSFGCRDLVESDTRPLEHSSCKQSKNQQEQVLKLRDVIEGLKPNDEDIPPNDTPMPTTQQGPMTRARARELNYRVMRTSTASIHPHQHQQPLVL
jgi:hypothetical protein